MIDLKRIFGKIKAFFRKTESPAINLGMSISVLVKARALVHRAQGRGVRVQAVDAYSWKRRRKPVRIDPQSEPNPHIVIVGMSGYGKSTLFKSMLMDISRMGIGAIVFDAHNEHERLVHALHGSVYDASTSGINLLELNGLSKQERISEIVSLLRGVYALGHIQATKLGQCLYYTYRKAASRGAASSAPTMRDLLAELSIFISNAKTASEKGTLMHLREKLSLLASGQTAGRQVPMDSLKQGINSFSLSGLRNREARIIYIHELLRRVYTSMKENGKERGLSLFVMIDEAQFLLGSQRGGSAITSMVEEGRKYGAGVVIATHITSNLDRQVLANASTLISFYSREPSEVNYISNAMSGSEPSVREPVRGRMRTLRQNEAIVISGAMKSPVIVATPRAFQVNSFIEMSGADGRAGAVISSSAPVEYGKAASEIGKEGLDRMIRLGEAELLEQDGKRWVMKKNRSKSIEHEVNVMRISERLSWLGISHYIMNNSKGPDLVAYVNGRKTAIEYETGRKGAASTARMLAARAKGYERVMVLVNSEAAEFYRNNFASGNISVSDISSLATMDWAEI